MTSFMENPLGAVHKIRPKFRDTSGILDYKSFVSIQKCGTGGLKTPKKWTSLMNSP